MDVYNRYKFNVMFVGDDWYQTDKWKTLNKEFEAVDVRIIYYPYTKGTSSTLINATLENLREVVCREPKVSERG